MRAASIFIVMGVSGCGKTTLAQKLAAVTGSEWLDADQFHTAENKAKMSARIPLTDEDRWPWLDRLNGELQTFAHAGKTVFLACSALKQVYRDRLAKGLPQAKFIYLKGSFDVIHARLAQRKNHFMPAGLLESQFATLEEPKDAIVLDTSRPENQLVEDFKRSVQT